MIISNGNGQIRSIKKGNSSIPLFKTHKSMDKKQNRGNKLKLRETHKYKRRTTTQHYNVTHTETDQASDKIPRE